LSSDLTEPPTPPSAEAVLAAVLEVTRESIGAASESAVADVVLRVSATLIGADQGTLGLVKDDEVTTIAALMPPRQPVGSKFPVGFGVAGWVAATGRPAEIQDVRLDKRYVALPYPEVRSFVGVPLSIGSELIGVLSLAAWRQGAFASRTAEALAPFAEHAALLLRHIAEDRMQRERLETLEVAAREGLAESLHELKSPLHAAAGFVDLVADELVGPLNAKQKDFLQTARAECARLKDALATLVEVGAAAAHRPLQLSRTDPSVLVTECVQRLRGQALSRDVCLSERVDPAVSTVQADRAAIQQVLANFLQNALRVSPPGSEIIVSAAAEPGRTVFAVADRGPGLPSGNADSLFEPFQQATGRDHERRAGEVGLGLALSRRIIEQHEGEIWAEPNPGGGARFCFALPAH